MVRSFAVWSICRIPTTALLALAFVVSADLVGNSRCHDIDQAAKPFEVKIFEPISAAGADPAGELPRIHVVKAGPDAFMEESFVTYLAKAQGTVTVDKHGETGRRYGFRRDFSFPDVYGFETMDAEVSWAHLVISLFQRHILPRAKAPVVRDLGRGKAEIEIQPRAGKITRDDILAVHDLMRQEFATKKPGSVRVRIGNYEYSGKDIKLLAMGYEAIKGKEVEFVDITPTRLGKVAILARRVAGFFAGAVKWGEEHLPFFDEGFLKVGLALTAIGVGWQFATDVAAPGARPFPLIVDYFLHFGMNFTNGLIPYAADLTNAMRSFPVENPVRWLGEAAAVVPSVLVTLMGYHFGAAKYGKAVAGRDGTRGVVESLAQGGWGLKKFLLYSAHGDAKFISEAGSPVSFGYQQRVAEALAKVVAASAQEFRDELNPPTIVIVAEGAMFDFVTENIRRLGTYAAAR